jgi:amino acid permease
MLTRPYLNISSIAFKKEGILCIAKRGIMKTPKAFYEAVATMTGCIVGAGIFGIPYVVARAGFWTGILVIFGIGIATLLIHLLVGEISLRSRTCHQLVGYAGKYLGRPGKYFMMTSMIIGVYGAMIAYTLGVSQSLEMFFVGPQWLWAIVFYIIMAVILFGGLEMLEESELWMEAVKYIVFIVILFMLFSSSHFSSERLTGFSWNNLFIPYGVILFASLGTAAIPEMREELKKCKLFTKRAIITGSVLSVLSYALFTFAVIGMSGDATTEVATIGLASSLVGGFGFILLHVFAILAMASSFVALGYALKQTYRVDFKLPHNVSWFLTLVVPAVLVIVGVQSFVTTLQVAGVFAGGIAGITVVLMHLKAKRVAERKPEYRVRLNWVVYSVLIGLFAAGMLYELFLFL